MCHKSLYTNINDVTPALWHILLFVLQEQIKNIRPPLSTEAT